MILRVDASWNQGDDANFSRDKVHDVVFITLIVRVVDSTRFAPACRRMAPVYSSISRLFRLVALDERRGKFKYPGSPTT